MWRQQALARGEYRSLSVALNRAALEYEVETVGIFASQYLCFEKTAVDAVVLFRLELVSPTVEAEIRQSGVSFAVGQRDESMVACPGVVGGAGVPDDASHLRSRQLCHEQLLYVVHMRRNHDKPFHLADGRSNLHIGLRDGFQTVVPVSVGMGPGEHDATLRLPFGGQYELVYIHGMSTSACKDRKNN